MILNVHFRPETEIPPAVSETIRMGSNTSASPELDHHLENRAGPPVAFPQVSGRPRQRFAPWENYTQKVVYCASCESVLSVSVGSQVGGWEWFGSFSTIVMVCVIAGGAKAAENAVTPGAFVVERPTLKSLGFEWKIAGDDNRNAAVDVTYRKTGEKRLARRPAAVPHGRRIHCRAQAAIWRAQLLQLHRAAGFRRQRAEP